MEGYKITLSDATQKILKIAGIIGAIAVFFNGYYLYINNVYVPTIGIVNKNYEEGYAQIKYKDKLMDIYGDATFSITGTWGVRLGSSRLDGKSIYNRVELINNGMVYDFLS